MSRSKPSLASFALNFCVAPSVGGTLILGNWAERRKPGHAHVELAATPFGLGVVRARKGM